MNETKTIEGHHDRATGRTTVSVSGDPVPLTPSLALANHSPTGFAWGYAGSGPAQLALALLIAFGCTPGEALRLHQRFKRDLIAGLAPHRNFTMPAARVTTWLAQERAAGREAATRRAEQCFARLQPPIEADISYAQLLDPHYAHEDAPRARLEFIRSWPEHACTLWGPHMCLQILEHAQDHPASRPLAAVNAAHHLLTNTVLEQFLPTPALRNASPYPFHPKTF